MPRPGPIKQKASDIWPEHSGHPVHCAKQPKRLPLFFLWESRENVRAADDENPAASKRLNQPRYQKEREALAQSNKQRTKSEQANLNEKEFFSAVAVGKLSDDWHTDAKTKCIKGNAP